MPGRSAHVLDRGTVQAATNVNERSSRSHSIFTIVLQQRDTENPTRSTFASVRHRAPLPTRTHFPCLTPLLSAVPCVFKPNPKHLR